MDSITPDPTPKGLSSPSLTSQNQSNIVSNTQHNASSGHPDHPRSCVFCRQRKVKCNRHQPCSNCTRYKLECTYPAGRGRAAKKSRQELDASVINRLHRMEDIIKQLTNEVNRTPGVDKVSTSLHESPKTDHHDPDNLEELPSVSSSSSPDAPGSQQVGRLVIDENKSYYVSNILWANLSSEIEELREMLNFPPGEDENYLPSDMSDMPSPFGTSAAVLGFYALSHSLLPYHPPMQQSVTLLTVFTENVLPLIHVFHMPTTKRMFWDAMASLDLLDKDTEALLFAIYYSAITSMDDDQCSVLLSTTRATSLEKYRFAVEQALARANILNTQSIILLQAAVLFLAALRNEDESRTTWSLTSLVLHIAKSMGLHRDGTTFGLKPFDTELRRRLWWQICLLDMRSSEFHGYEPIVIEGTFDTKLPLNINDADINPQMTDPPQENHGFTDSTFCLVRSEAMKARWKIGSVWTHVNSAANTMPKEREGFVENVRAQLEEQYLRHCDPSVPLMLFVATISRLMISRIWLIALLPRHQKVDQPTNLSTQTRDTLFTTSIEVLELSGDLLTNRDVSNWIWYAKNHLQLHAVVFVLSEICSRPPSAQRDRAWECVNRIYNERNMKEGNQKSNIWRPIKRLMAKARYLYEVQNIHLNPSNMDHIPAASMPNTITVSMQSVDRQQITVSDNMDNALDLNEYLDLTMGAAMYGNMTNMHSWDPDENIWG